jgi:hypothetical protein
MGDISGAVFEPVRMEVTDLSEGWSFKQSDQVGESSWSPVKKVPSTVQQDLIDNKKYVPLRRASPRLTDMSLGQA